MEKAKQKKNIIRILGWMSLLLSVGVILLVVFTFQNENTTVGTGRVVALNSDWTLTTEEKTINVTLPYFAKSEPEATISLSRTVDEELAGKTLAFLSADITVFVTVGGEKVYSFGWDGNHWFGKTPGSLKNYVDIPADAAGKELSIRATSPYSDYAGIWGSVSYGARDDVILSDLRGAIPAFALIILVFSMGILFLLISPVRTRATGGSHGMPFLAVFCFMECVQSAIETKTLSIFYGNSVLYSVIILVLNTAFPCFFLLYYENRFEEKDRKGFTPLIVLSFADILIQTVLQLSGARDFLEMASFTHLVIAIVLLFVAWRFLSAFRRTRNMRYVQELFAMSFFAAGVLIDVIRSMIIKVGDFALFTRIGMAVYTVILAYIHITEAIRENDAILQDNYRLMEKQLASEKAELKRAEAERDEADRKSDAKSRFLASMSHEIRTPINTILGMNTMILRESTEGPVREYAGNVDSAAKNLLSLINDILDFSKIESGKVEIVPVDLSMSSLINDVAVMIRGRAEAKGLTLKVEADPLLPEKARGDETRIKQVMVNILTNAVKYTKEGTVTFSVRRKDAVPLTPGQTVPVEIRVEDTGMGIRPENLGKIFDSFQRVDERKNRSIEGTGLGLAITKQITCLMGGEITAESEYGKGSVFTVTLPVLPLGTETVGDFSKRISETADAGKDTGEDLYAPDASILVVDDNRMNLKVFTLLLKNSGLSIDQAASGAEALTLAESKTYDIIFLDDMMSEMSGKECLAEMQRRAHADPAYKNRTTPVVCLTANAVSGAREEYLSLGFTSYLSKPVKAPALEGMIRDLLPEGMSGK